MPEPLRKFVILHHVLASGTHWDLMLDVGQALATWQLTADPRLLAAPESKQRVPARRIADHRRSYLDYEGPVSGNRGQVRRIDAGTYELLEATQEAWVVRLSGQLLSGPFRLSSPAGAAHGELRRDVV